MSDIKTVFAVANIAIALSKLVGSWPCLLNSKRQWRLARCQLIWCCENDDGQRYQHVKQCRDPNAIEDGARKITRRVTSLLG